MKGPPRKVWWRKPLNRAAKLTAEQREEMLRAYLDKRKSSTQLGAKYNVHPAYVRFLAHVRKNGNVRYRYDEK